MSLKLIGVLIILILVALIYYFQIPTSENIFINNSQRAQNIPQEPPIEVKSGKPSPISIEYLRTLQIESETPILEEELSNGSNYRRYIASFLSEGNKIYGLLTIPNSNKPNGGYPAIVFNHGYIPPTQYKTTEKYVSYVDYLARNGFVVFKIDLRGH